MVASQPQQCFIFTESRLDANTSGHINTKDMIYMFKLLKIHRERKYF